MHYLVLGSAGQIGAPLCKYLELQGHTVTGFDLVTGQDLREPSEHLTEEVQRADLIFFLAFDVGGSRYLKSYQHTASFIDNNLRLMRTVFHELRHKPFIFASSQMASMSYSPYGALKMVGEYYTQALNGLTVKFWNVYGPEHDEKKFHAISDFIKSAKTKGRIELLTTGEEVRQLLHVTDAAAALHTLAGRYDSIPLTMPLHITSFEWTKIIDVARIIGRRLNADIIPGQATDFVQRDARNEPNNAILEYWTPTIDLEQGIAQVIAHQ